MLRMADRLIMVVSIACLPVPIIAVVPKLLAFLKYCFLGRQNDTCMKLIEIKIVACNLCRSQWHMFPYAQNLAIYLTYKISFLNIMSNRQNTYKRN